MEILWGCLSIFILCTWTILHLNVPRIRPPAGTWMRLWFTIVDAQTKIKWMLITLVLPELILGKAVNDRASAYQWYSRQPKGTRRPVQNYLANMGYFVLDWNYTDHGSGNEPNSESNVEGESSPLKLDERFQEMQTHIDVVLRESALMLAKGYSYPKRTHINASRLKSRYWALNARQWAHMKDWGIAELPNTPDYQLERLDSGSSLVKIFALVQTLWLALQLLVRLIRGYPSSPLEVGALAFAIQSSLTYSVNFSKPHNVLAVCLVNPRPWSGGSLEGAEKKVERLVGAGSDYLWDWERPSLHFDEDVGPFPVPNDGTNDMGSSMGATDGVATVAVIVAVSSLIFGGIHCAAWNSTFPSPVEATLWRTCAIITAVMPIIVFSMKVFFKILTIQSKITSQTWHLTSDRMNLCLLMLYTLVRLFMIVEMFRALVYAPPEVYKNTWTAEIPHL
ncbi:hypothetical protein IQ07DRAFT_584435 [Pyrenochaeta sp. DS3sAY3a]|nr:hypothetical protein IQ07DRAFT_584435 [Pyrenochaeta sp. DS3sAY3a]